MYWLKRIQFQNKTHYYISKIFIKNRKVLIVNMMSAIKFSLLHFETSI